MSGCQPRLLQLCQHKLCQLKPRLFQLGRSPGWCVATAGAQRQDIREKVRKTDGKRANIRAIDAIIAHARDDPDYDGHNSGAGGRPRELTAREESKVKKLVHQEVGRCVVTTKFLKKIFPALRRVTDRCVRDSLHRLGLAWRMRHCKAAIGKKYKPQRLEYCRWILAQKQSFLNCFAPMLL